MAVFRQLDKVLAHIRQKIFHVVSVWLIGCFSPPKVSKILLKELSMKGKEGVTRSRKSQKGEFQGACLLDAGVVVPHCLWVKVLKHVG